MKRLGGAPRPWRWNLANDTTYPLGGSGSRWSAGGAIHSGDDSEVRWRRSPSLSSSSNRRSVIDDGGQSSAATSLTGILDGRRAGSLLLEGVRAREMARELRQREDKARMKTGGGRENGGDAAGYS